MLPIRPLTPLALLLGFSFLHGCISERAEPGTSIQAIVYGEDDRQDVFEVEPLWARVATERAVALIPSAHLTDVVGSGYQTVSPTYGAAQTLCAGERFAEQPVAASCSGVLVAPNLVATSAHCLGVDEGGAPSCSNNRYVFKYAILAPAEWSTEPEDLLVLDCVETVAVLKSPAGSACHVDLALVRLERSLELGTALPLRERSLDVGERVTVIGFPAGLPAKVDRGGTVRSVANARQDVFELDSDTFSVSSGSAVLDEAGNLVGIFARGYADYEPGADGGCQRTRHLDPTSAPGFEQAMTVNVLRLMLASEEAGTLDRDLPVILDATCGMSSLHTPVAASGADGPKDASAEAVDDAGASRRDRPGGCTVRATSHMTISWVGILGMCSMLLLRRRRREPAPGPTPPVPDRARWLFWLRLR